MAKTGGFNGDSLGERIRAEEAKRDPRYREKNVPGGQNLPALRGGEVLAGVALDEKLIELEKRRQERLLELAERKRDRLDNQEVAFPISEIQPRRRKGKHIVGVVPQKWTEAQIVKVADDMAKYIDESDFPTLAEFCYIHGIYSARINESSILREMNDLLHAKCQAMIIRRGVTLGQGEGPLGQFLQKLAMNMGQFSLTDKSEVAHSGGVNLVLSRQDEKL